MPLFVVRHHHTAEACPASLDWGPELLVQISAATAARHGVSIEAEAVIDGEHGLLLIVEAANREQVEGFLSFLTGFGSVEVLPAWSSEGAVARRGCPGAPYENRPSHPDPAFPYRAYLVRLWQESADGPWRALTSDAQTYEQCSFDTVEQLFLFLHRQTEGAGRAESPTVARSRCEPEGVLEEA
jgi:hypothetical protein